MFNTPSNLAIMNFEQKTCIIDNVVKNTKSVDLKMKNSLDWDPTRQEMWTILGPTYIYKVTKDCAITKFSQIL